MARTDSTKSAQDIVSENELEQYPSNITSTSLRDQLTKWRLSGVDCMGDGQHLDAGNKKNRTIWNNKHSKHRQNITQFIDMPYGWQIQIIVHCHGP